MTPTWYAVHVRPWVEAFRVVMPRRGLVAHRSRTLPAGATAVAVAAFVVATGGSAYAYFRSTGSATTSGTVGSESITLPATAATVSGLYPGGSVTNVHITVTNPSSSAGPVTVQSAVGGTVTISVSGPMTTGTTCNPSVVTFTATSLPSAINPGNTGDVVGTVAMGTGAGNQCQGDTFSIPVTVTGKT